MVISDLVTRLGVTPLDKITGSNALKTGDLAGFSNALKELMPESGPVVDEEPGKQFFSAFNQSEHANSSNLNGFSNLDGNSFSGTVGEFMSDVNSLQSEAHELTERMIKGEPVDIHDVMIATEKAKTSFQLLLEIRNKFLDMYKEVSRIQV